MEITFLGTGTSQGIPVIGCDCKICESKNSKDKRLRSSIYIKYNNTNIIIDTGPDFRQQALKEKIKNLDFILYTHAHKDHTGGIDDIRSFNFFLKKKIPIYGNKKTMNQIINDYSYIFKKNNYTALPKLSINYINNDFKKNGILIKPIKVKHNKLDILGYRINNFTYITDADEIRLPDLSFVCHASGSPLNGHTAINSLVYIFICCSILLNLNTFSSFFSIESVDSN